MAYCNFLMKLPKDAEHTFIAFETCEVAHQNLAALHFWIQRHADLGITAGNFKQKVREHKIECEVWCRYIHMVAVCDQQFLIKLVEVPKRKGSFTLVAEPGRIQMKALEALRDQN